MSFTINTNLASINAQRHLGLSGSSLSTSMQRLSSGLRINSAKDDAAGLAISERMQAQVRGMNQAARNANDGISMLQTAEGASSKVTDMLQRMRELAVQSINFTNSDNDRKALNAEVQQLKAEIDRVGMTSKFNGAVVFDTTRKSVMSTDATTFKVLSELRNGLLAQVEQVILERYGISAQGNMTLDIKTSREGAGGFAAYVTSSWSGTSGRSSSLALTIDLDDYNGTADAGFIDLLAHEMVHAVMGTSDSWVQLRREPTSGSAPVTWFTEGVAEFISGSDGRVAADGGWNAISSIDIFNTAWDSSSTHYSAGYMAVKHMHAYLKTAGVADGVAAVLQHLHTNNVTGSNQDAVLAAAVNAVIGTTTTYNYANFKSDHLALNNTSDVSAWFKPGNPDSGGIGGQDAEGANAPARTGSTPETMPTGTEMASFGAKWQDGGSQGGGGLGNILGFQVGANAGQIVYARVGSMNLGSMALEDLSIATAADATGALGQLDVAIDYVSSLRGELGAQMNRFEAVIATLNVMVENTSASRGRIVDADFAIETANLSRSQILQQAGTAMVSQANQLPQNVLSLLR